MAGMKEIRGKIKSVQNTRKITKAMEMVAASKMRRAQERMRAGRPYAQKIGRLAANLALANVTDYRHPFLGKVDNPKKVGMILVTTVKSIKEWEEAGVTEIRVTAVGNKGYGFMQRMGAKIISNVTQLGDTPHLERLIGPVKVMIDAYLAGEVDAVYVAFNQFVNTMKQEPRML